MRTSSWDLHRPPGPLLAAALLTLSACGPLEELPSSSSPTSGRAEALSTRTPNDPLFAQQRWHLEAMRVPEAWSLTTGDPSTLVAVLDSGSLPHEDLDAKWESGYDFYEGDNDPVDRAGTYHHGIHTAGIIGAVANNNVGGAGICWGCKLMPVRVLQGGGTTQAGYPGVRDYPRALSNAIRYAAGLPADNGWGQTVQAPRRAAVINISIGQAPAPCNPLVQAAVNAAVAAGTVVVASAANTARGDADASHYFWPTCNNVIAVTAVDQSGQLEPYATRGNGITIAAPGGSAVNSLEGYGQLLGGCSDPTDRRTLQGTHGAVSTWVTAPGAACYRHWAGTSMSAAHVTSVVALMRSVNPSLTPAEITQILKSTAKPTCVGCGAGLIDAAQAVSAALPVRNDAAFVWQSVPGTLRTGQRAPVSITMCNRGTSPWTEDLWYRLGSDTPQNNGTWGVARLYLSPGELVAPGQCKRFEFTITAPAQAGTYTFQWRMLRELQEWFGDQSPPIQIQVVAARNDAWVAGQTLFSALRPSQTTSASVTMCNRGNTVWTEDEWYRLGSSAPQNNGTWGVARLYLKPGESVSPGQCRRFDFPITAPAQPGRYDYQWCMLRELQEWFGDCTPLRQIQVAP